MPWVAGAAAVAGLGYSIYKGETQGKTKSLPTTTPEILPFRKQLAQAGSDALNGQGPFAGAFGQVNDYNLADNSFFQQNILNPYRDLFAANRTQALAQAKESAGNLTGSGYNNLFGSALQTSLAQENAGLADIMTQLREQDINRGLALRGQDLGRQSDLLHFLQGFSTAGVGGQQNVYQPGLLDSIAPLIGTWLASRK